MPMTDEQLAKLKVPVLHFPTVFGGVVPTYNVPGVTQPLKFTPETLAGIFLGTIKKWNDPVEEGQSRREFPERGHNRGAPLGRERHHLRLDRLSFQGEPGVEIESRRQHLRELASRLGGKGNEGVAGLVKQTPNSIGYVELIYAVQNKMAYGW